MCQDLTVRVGAFVAADMGDGYWCRGTAVSISGGIAEFVSTDGRKIAVAASKLIPFSKNPAVKVGDPVLVACPGDSILYPATVKAMAAAGVLVVWGGGPQEIVPPDRLVRLADAGKARFAVPDGKPASSGAVAPSRPFGSGDSAAGLLPDGKWHIGIIDGPEGEGFRFITNEGGSAPLPKSKIRALSAEPPLAPGQAVGAIWGREDVFSAGIVQRIENGGAVIEWIDGMRPCFVGGGKILVGVEAFRQAANDQKKEKLVSFKTQNTAYQIAPDSGRIYAGTVLVGEFDFMKGSAAAGNGGGRVEIADDGSLRSRKKTTRRSGRLERSGALFLGNDPVGAIGRDGWIYRGSVRWAELDEKKPTWNELRMIAAVMVLCTDDFGF